MPTGESVSSGARLIVVDGDALAVDADDRPLAGCDGVDRGRVGARESITEPVTMRLSRSPSPTCSPRTFRRFAS